MFCLLDVTCPARDSTFAHGSAVKFIKKSGRGRMMDSDRYRYNTYGGFIQYTCSSGYRISFSSKNTTKVTCNDSGKWSGDIPTCSGKISNTCPVASQELEGPCFAASCVYKCSLHGNVFVRIIRNACQREPNLHGLVVMSISLTFCW